MPHISHLSAWIIHTSFSKRPKGVGMRVDADEGECVCKIKRTIYRYIVRIRRVKMRVIQRYL